MGFDDTTSKLQCPLSGSPLEAMRGSLALKGAAFPSGTIPGCNEQETTRAASAHVLHCPIVSV